MNVATGGDGQAIWIHMDFELGVRPDPEHDIWYIFVIDLWYVLIFDNLDGSSCKQKHPSLANTS